MILFKRVGDSFRHIEDREWVLLFLETLGVLVGILLAFALQEWAQRRSEAAKHRQLMERLLEETQWDVKVLRGWRDDLQNMIKPEEAFAVAVAKGQCPSQPEWNSANTLNMIPWISAPTAVYQELTGAGGLSSVSRGDVRRELAIFHGALDWTQQQVVFFREARVSPLDPSDRRATVVFDPTRDEPEVWTFDRAALCADRPFKNRIASATRAHVVYAGYVKDLTDDAITMCAALAESLGRSCIPRNGALKGDDARLAAETVEKMRKTPAES
ncbi:MAG TPA: hypothetical protein VH392_10170 [Sphingomicrobium sp.]|jgi:hypothetical protein